ARRLGSGRARRRPRRARRRGPGGGGRHRRRRFGGVGTGGRGRVRPRLPLPGAEPRAHRADGRGLPCRTRTAQRLRPGGGTGRGGGVAGPGPASCAARAGGPSGGEPPTLHRPGGGGGSGLHRLDPRGLGGRSRPARRLDPHPPEAVVTLDPAALRILIGRLTGVADEMGAVLRRAAFSPNIKERADCSAALFTPAGELLAQAEHIPVHLGSMPASVLAAIDAFGARETGGVPPTGAAGAAQVSVRPGDQIVLNDPFAGGTHLNDITLVAP